MKNMILHIACTSPRINFLLSPLFGLWLCGVAAEPNPCVTVSTDGNGIPDKLEKAHELDSSEPTDGRLIITSGYTNLNSLI